MKVAATPCRNWRGATSALRLSVARHDQALAAASARLAIYPQETVMHLTAVLGGVAASCPPALVAAARLLPRGPVPGRGLVPGGGLASEGVLVPGDGSVPDRALGDAVQHSESWSVPVAACAESGLCKAQTRVGGV